MGKILAACYVKSAEDGYSQIKVMKTDSCIKKEYRSLFFGRVEKRIDVAASSVLY